MRCKKTYVRQNTVLLILLLQESAPRSHVEAGRNIMLAGHARRGGWILFFIFFLLHHGCGVWLRSCKNRSILCKLLRKNLSFCVRTIWAESLDRHDFICHGVFHTCFTVVDENSFIRKRTCLAATSNGRTTSTPKLLPGNATRTTFYFLAAGRFILEIVPFGFWAWSLKPHPSCLRWLLKHVSCDLWPWSSAPAPSSPCCRSELQSLVCLARSAAPQHWRLLAAPAPIEQQQQLWQLRQCPEAPMAMAKTTWLAKNGNPEKSFQAKMSLIAPCQQLPCILYSPQLMFGPGSMMIVMGNLHPSDISSQGSHACASRCIINVQRHIYHHIYNGCEKNKESELETEKEFKEKSSFQKLWSLERHIMQHKTIISPQRNDDLSYAILPEMTWRSNGREPCNMHALLFWAQNS